jgi:predicted transcriptional regulator
MAAGERSSRAPRRASGRATDRGVDRSADATAVGDPAPVAGRDEAAVRRFVEHMAMTLADWGFPRMPARVLVTMMSADEDALTAGQLAERLGVSPAAISGAVRYLMHVGLLLREPVAGSRSDRYRMPYDAWYEATLTKGQLFSTVTELAEGGVKALGGAGTPSGARVAEMRDFMHFVQGELAGLLDRWQAAKARADGEPGR